MTDKIEMSDELRAAFAKFGEQVEQVAQTGKLLAQLIQQHFPDGFPKLEGMDFAGRESRLVDLDPRAYHLTDPENASNQ